MNKESQHSNHPSSLSTYWILLALLVVSIAGPLLAPAAPAGMAVWITISTAFGIAVIKALMVAARFMHLNVEKRLIWRLLIICLLLMGVLFATLAVDILKSSGQNWINQNDFQPGHTHDNAEIHTPAH